MRLRVKPRWKCPKCKRRLSLRNFYPEHETCDFFGNNLCHRTGLCYECWTMVDMVNDEIARVVFVPVTGS